MFFRNVKSAVSTCSPSCFRRNCIIPCFTMTFCFSETEEKGKKERKKETQKGSPQSLWQERSVLCRLKQSVAFSHQSRAGRCSSLGVPRKEPIWMEACRRCLRAQPVSAKGQAPTLQDADWRRRCHRYLSESKLGGDTLQEMQGPKFLVPGPCGLVYHCPQAPKQVLPSRRGSNVFAAH